MKDLKRYRKIANRSLSEYRHVSKQVKEEKVRVKVCKKKVKDATEAQQIVQTVAQQVQQQAHAQIAAVVTRCLKAVFDHPYKFKVEFERKRGKTEARLIFEKKGLEMHPVDGIGGGVLDVAAFGLRLACLLLQKPPRRRLLVLDEPFRAPSDRKDYKFRVRELVETLARELKVQMIIVTHDPVLEIGKVIELK